MDEIVLNTEAQAKLRALLESLQSSHSDYDYDKSLVVSVIEQCPAARALFGDIYKERGFVKD